MTRFRPIHVVLVIMLMISGATYAQDNSCDDAVLEAKRLYESGNFNDCINRLEPCLATISDRSLKATAYRLISLAYLATKNNEKANEYAVLLLKIQPDYQKFPQIDPAEFTKIINSYEVEKNLWVGIRAGLNQNWVERFASYSAYESTQSYLASRGFQAGLSVDYAFNPNLYISSLFNIVGIGIQHKIDDVGVFRQEYNEEQRYVGIQLSANGRFSLIRNINIHPGIGGGFGSLYESTVELITINKETKSVQTYTQDVLENRNRTQTYLSGSLGVSFGLGKGEFMLHCQYDYYMQNTLSDKHRYANMDFNLSTHYVNDDVRNRVMSYSISYRHPIVFKVKPVNK